MVRIVGQHGRKTRTSGARRPEDTELHSPMPSPTTHSPDTDTDAATASTGFNRRSFLNRSAAVAAGSAAASVLGSAALADPAAAAVEAVPFFSDLPKRKDIPRRARIVDYEIVEMVVLLRAREMTSTQLTKAYLARIDAYNGPFEIYGNNGGYNAFVRIDRAEALAQAAAADARFRFGGNGSKIPLLCGIPFGIKDSVAVSGRESKNGTHAYDGNVALKDATIIARLREQGAVLIGHTIASAFSGSISGTFAGNAWNAQYIPGGSSQGSGVAPVARLAAAAIGEETGGSIIMPAACNGASAIKPSLGLNSTAGVMPLSPGYDVVGPLARSVRDAALILSITAGPDQVNDPLTLSAPLPTPTLPISPRTSKRRPLAGVRIGVPQTDWMSAGGTGKAPAETYDADYRFAFERTKTQLRALGATVFDFAGLDVTVPENDPYFRSRDVLATIADAPVSPATAVLNPNRYEIKYWEAPKQFAATVPESQAALLRAAFGDFDARTAAAGAVPESVRVEGENRRKTLQANFQQALDDARVDFMLVMPIGAKIGPRTGGTQLPNYRTFYQLPNALAWPMVTFPVGYDSTSDGLPINAAFWGPRFSEAQLVQTAIDYQDRYPEYNRAAPPDPAALASRQAPSRRGAVVEPAFEVVEPELSTDPLIAEQAWR